jgi:hypothetical protein
MSNQITRREPTADNPDGIDFIPESVAVDSGKTASPGGSGGGAVGCVVAGPLVDFVTNHGTAPLPSQPTGSGYKYIQSIVPGNPPNFNDGTRDYTWNEENGFYINTDISEFPSGDFWSAFPIAAGDQGQTDEYVQFGETIGGVQVASYVFNRIDGVWVYNPDAGDTSGAVGPTPVVPDDLTFFPNYTREHI